MKRLRDDACGFAAGEHPGPDAILGFVLGTLEPGVERALEAHLAGCAACAAALTIEAAREQALWSTSSSWSALADERPLAPIIPLTLPLSPGCPRASTPRNDAPLSQVVAEVTTAPPSVARPPANKVDDRVTSARRGFAAGWASGVAAAALIGIFAGRGGLTYDGVGIGGGRSAAEVPGATAAMCGDVVAGEALCRPPRGMLVAVDPTAGEPPICSVTGGAGGACEAAAPVLVSQAMSSPEKTSQIAVHAASQVAPDQTSSAPLASAPAAASFPVTSRLASFMSAFPAAPMSRAE